MKIKLNTLLLGLLLIAVAIIAYCLGASSAYEDLVITTRHAQISPVDVRLISTHTVEYVEKIVIEKEYVDVVRDVPVEYRNFTDQLELQQWLEERNKTATIYFQRGDAVIDCDDFAMELQKEALADGYIISFEIISVNEYNHLFSIPLPESQSLHAINLSIIGNDVYYIEPQTGEIAHVSFLD
jgi:hypothetical protein